MPAQTMDTDYREMVNAMARRDAELNPKLPEGVRFGLYTDSVALTPYVKATCSRCKNEVFLFKPDQKFIHCGVRDEVPYAMQREWKSRIKKAKKREPAPSQQPVTPKIY